jgi:hypothetical protein
MLFAHQWSPGLALDGECFGLHDGDADDLVGVDLKLEMEMSEPELFASLQDCQKLKTVRWAGTWRLAPQRALSLLPRRDSQLLVVQGGAWITWDHPLALEARRGGDHFLEAGQILDVPAGVRLVMEARQGQADLRFDWREVPQDMTPCLVPSPTLAELARQWRLAWGQALGASARLGLGVLMAGALLLVRGRWRQCSRGPSAVQGPV